MEIFLIISGLIILALFANGAYLIASVFLLTIGGGVTAFFVWLSQLTSEEFAKLPQLNALTNRMKSIVYVAQQDYHFASIFEQRKTQKLLVAGFESFADVLNDVGDQIDNHLGDLNTTVQSYNEEMTSLMEASAEQRERHHEEVMETINKDSDR